MPAISQKAKRAITKQIDLVVKKYLKKAIESSNANSGNPFVMALLKDFEPLLHRIHGLKTSLGSEMEKIAEIIAIEAWGRDNIKRKINTNVQLPQNVFQIIDSIINNLSNAKKLSNYAEEKKLIIDACNNPSKKMEEHTYEFDLELFDEVEKHYYYLEMKGPDPNTTEVSGAKKRLLVSLAWCYLNNRTETIDSRLGIYYNNTYPRPYKNPKVHYYFDPDGGMIVHEDFWNFIGKNNTTYNELIKVFENYGKRNKKKIWDGFSKLIKVK
jgi:hypothetical protein